MADRLHRFDPGVWTIRWCRGAGIAGLLIATAASAQQSAVPAPAPLAYRIEEGRILNAFFRDGPVAAHLLLRSGEDPRLLVAFPAGNSGVGLWFAHLTRDARWRRPSCRSRRSRYASIVLSPAVAAAMRRR